MHNIYAIVSNIHLLQTYLDVTDSDPDVTSAASLPTQLSRDSQVENVLSSKRHLSTSVGRRTRRKLK